MPSLHLEYVKEGEKTATSTDRIIREYIESNSLEYYDEVISSDHRYPVFYHLSMLRTGLLSWYDFRPQADVLEIGAGFGALTGLLCDKCSHVTVTEGSSYRAKALALRWQKKENLDIYAGEWSKISFGKQFDYIILNGILERTCAGSKERSGYADYLQKIANLLKPDGILLFSVENRMGLKYFCGAAEPHTNRAFDGINGYPKGTGGYSFSRQELKNIIKEAGFSAHKFYYPLPDYKLPQLIYTDEYLPQQNVRERLIPYYYPEKNMIAVERELYRDVVENQVFPFFANSFLVECGNREAFGDVIYAAVSTDRGPDRSYATTIHKDKTVKKLPLCKEGLKNAESLYGNIVDLREHDIPVVGTLWEDGRLSMPFIPFPTLSDYMKEIMPVNLTHFQELLDRLYAYILQSSEEIQGVNGLSDRLCSRGESEEEKAKIKSLNWGPILKRAYMELIPLNCFYDKTNHQFLFFDQEFVREDYPAKYVLFRAIHYIYCFTPDAETYLPGKILREKYGLQETWEYYLKEEKAFLDEIRNHRMYRNFYRWTHVNKSEIYGNADKLMSEEEKIANYTVSDKMKKVWKVELDMLDRVDAICKKHHLQYFIVHGTLLGAVRHKGFIPWDDDLDIGMLRKDYDRFLEIAAMEFKDPYVIQNMWTEKDCFLGGYTRIRNSHTTGIQVREIGHRSNQGIWIDILPIDNCTMNEERFQKKGKQIKHAYRLLMAKVYGKEKSPLYDLTPWKWQAYRLMAKGSSHASLCGKLDRAMRLYTNEETEDVAIFSSYEKYQVLRKADFESTVSLEFAGRRLPAPAGYENYLFITQGKDYMKYPPEVERRPKHKGIFDPERPYTEYLQKLTGMFDDIKGKQIILFGAGMMFDDYMQNWGGSYRPSFLVDNDQSKWGRSRKGIEIKSPGEILKIPVSKRRLIICSFYYKEIEKQLEEMGITDYQVYVQHAEWIVQAEEK